MNTLAQFQFRRGDFLAIALVVLIAVATAAAFILPGDASGVPMLEVWQDGRMIREISMQDDQSLQIAGQYNNTITVQDGRAAITDSNCPGGDCMHSGWIDQPGRSIVCLPNRVELRIAGTSEVDFVVG